MRHRSFDDDADRYEDDEGPDDDCCPWREPVDRYDLTVDVIACAIVGHTLRSGMIRRCCSRCGWDDAPDGMIGHFMFDNLRAFRDLIDEGAKLDAARPVANGIIRGITDLGRI